MGYSDLKEMLKDARNLATGANDLQLKGMLLDIQGAVYDLYEENRELREENHSLKNQTVLENEMEFFESVYYIQNKGRYFCSSCWDSNKQLISVADYSREGNGTKTFYCPVCDTWKSSSVPAD